MRNLLDLFSSATSTLADAGPSHTKIAGREVALWKPEGAEPTGGFPVVIFSHGFGGCNTQSGFLMEAMTRAGYFVVAPNHADAHCRGTDRQRSGAWRPEEPFGRAWEWSDQTHKDRREDVVEVLDAMLAARSFEGVAVDAGRIGIAGHSLGGYTALGLAGGWASWKDRRIQAVLALSPFNTPFVAKGNLERLNVPVMYQGGTLDFGITPTVSRPDGAYDQTSLPKYYVEFRRAGHFAFTDLNQLFHGLVNRYSLAFFDRYLKGKNGNELAALFGQDPPRGVNFVRSDVR
jgi:predicted dienelactone hydrolase